jgi:hypothetical protein
MKILKTAAALPVFCSVLYFLFRLFGSDIIIHNSGYTYLRYAYNIISGFGYSYNADGVHTYGTAGILNTYLLVILKSVFKSTHGAYILVFAAALFAGAALLGLLFLLYDRKDFQKPEMNIFGAFTITWLIFLTPFVNFVLSGEDTFLSASLIILAIILLYRLKNSFSIKNAVFFSISFWLCYNSRIENFFFISIFTFLFIFLEKFSSKEKKVLFGMLAVVLFIDVLLKHFYFNSIFPLPFYAKKIGFLNYYPTGKQSSIHNLKLFLLYSAPFILVFIFTVTKETLKTVVNYLLPLTVILLLLMFADHSEAAGARYFFPFIFAVIIVSYYTLNKFTDTYIINKDVINIILKSRAVYAGVFVIIWAVVNFGLENYYDTKYSFSKGGETREISLWKKYPPLPEGVRAELLTDIIKALPQNSKAAVLFAGFNFPGKNLNLIDLSGCNNTEIAKEGFSFEVISRISPDIILLPDSSFKNLNAMIINNEEFNKEFIYLPNVLKSGLAISRKNYQSAKDIIEILRAYYRKTVISNQ